MALEAQVASLPVGTKHHFLELDRILGLLHKDLQGTQVTVKGGGRGVPSLRSGLHYPLPSLLPRVPTAFSSLPGPEQAHLGGYLCLCVHLGVQGHESHLSAVSLWEVAQTQQQ